jgi:Family of unknown function (DUF5670)
MGRIIYTIVVILLALWVAGLVFKLMAGAIHILLVVAVLVVLWDVLVRRRHTV